MDTINMLIAMILSFTITIFNSLRYWDHHDIKMKSEQGVK